MDMAFLFHYSSSSYSNILFLFFVLSISIAMYRYRRRSTILTNWPLLGMTPALLVNAHRVHDFATDILKTSGGTFLFKGPWLANMDMLVTADPANVHYMLSKNFPNYPKGPEFRKMFDILGDGIFNSDYELWEIHRKTTMSLFKHTDFLPLLEKTVWNKVQTGLLPVLRFVSKQGMETDLQEIFQRFTFDGICKLVLDYDPETLSVDMPYVPCEKAFTDTEEAIFHRHVFPDKVWKLQKRLQIGKEKKLSDAWKTFDEFIYKCLSRNTEDEDESGSQEFELWKALRREFKGKTSGGDDDDEKKFLKDTILNLMVAGRDTTSTALSWFFYLVGKNPGVEVKIREEIRRQLNGEKYWGAKELSKMVYLHGGLCEALRLFPPVALEQKEAIEADMLPSGHSVEKNARIILSFYSMGRMESIWGEDCMEFKPERWFSDSDRGSGIKHQPSYKFTAFHAGPRTCLGKDMAFIQMKMVATTIIHHYQVELLEGHKVCPSDSIILQMKYGLKVKLHKIDQLA